MNRKKERKSQSGFCIFPSYKFCGPNCSGPGKPFNEVDDCCKKHDECLQKHPQCYCDQKFRECLRPKVNLTSDKGRVSSHVWIYVNPNYFYMLEERLRE